MHVNYRYLVDKAKALRQEDLRGLDVGCGKGDLVRHANAEGSDFRGIEYFGPGSGVAIRDKLEQSGELGTTVFAYDGRTFPFDDNEFDVVVSNQVFEHVPDLERIVSEVARVLKPGGHLFCTFPYLEMYREVHCNVPFAQRIPKSKFREVYLYIFCCMGIHRIKNSRTNKEWGKFMNEWLDENTFYRNKKDIHSIFADNFLEFRFEEIDYLKYRFKDEGRERLANLLSFPPLKRPGQFLYQKFGSLVISAKVN